MAQFEVLFLSIRVCTRCRVGLLSGFYEYPSECFRNTLSGIPFSCLPTYRDEETLLMLQIVEKNPFVSYYGDALA